MIGDKEINMKQTLILSLCFLPLSVIFVFLKLSLWLSESLSEVKYVKEDVNRPHGPYVEDPYGDSEEKDENYGNLASD